MLIERLRARADVARLAVVRVRHGRLDPRAVDGALEFRRTTLAGEIEINFRAVQLRVADLARADGARTVDLTSRPSREAANRLYERLGFQLRDSKVYRLTGDGVV